MAKDTTIFYQDQVEICKRHFNAEQFGRLMLALFEVEEGNEPEVAEDIAIAFEFMALQKRIDRKKYEALCEKNRENGKKGGRPKKGANKNPQKANGFFENPNDNENDNENDNKNDDDAGFHHHDSLLHLGSFENVELTEKEHAALKQQYERSQDLIEKVSIWLRSAKNPVEDHYALCVKFANNDGWPKKKLIEPSEPIVVTDPLDQEEQERMMAQLHEKLNGAIASG